jgi:methylated-DNA-protein-cysteine methyltransferase related protein
MSAEDVGFFERVYEVVRKVPKGRVTSYGAIGSFLGAPQAARMVGWAMNNAHHVFPPVPAHRVVNRKGLLTGKHHFAYETQMQELLENEGMRVFNNQVVDFKKVFWNPAEEL